MHRVQNELTNLATLNRSKGLHKHPFFRGKPLQQICDKLEAILLGNASADELFYEDLSDDPHEST